MPNENSALEEAKRIQLPLLEAPTIAARRAAIAELFDPKFVMVLNGVPRDWDWLEEHMIQLEQQLSNISVEFTHAARQGNSLLGRHIIHATDRASGDPWVMEVFYAMEFNADGKIAKNYEVVSMIDGRYEGGW